jgi:hypothetical protein
MISDELNRIIKAKSDLKDFLQKMGIDAEDAKVSDLATIFSVLIDNMLIIPKGTELHAGSFSSYNITRVFLPETVSIIPDSCFNSCGSLSSINFPKSISTIGRSAFATAGKLSGELDLPNLQNLGSTAFVSTNISKIISLGNLKLLSSSAFCVCPKLISAVLPDTLTGIEASAFGGSAALKYIKCLATIPPTSGKGPFDGSVCPIYVPDASVSAYQASTNWIAYASRIKPLSTFIE